MSPIRFCSAGFSLPLLLLTCGPAPEPLPAPEGEYVNPEVKSGARGNPDYGEYRILLQDDSLRFFSPFDGMAGGGLPAYAADSTARFTDTAYAVYQLQADSSLEVQLHRVGEAPAAQRLLYRGKVARSAPSPEVQGRTYESVVDGVPILFYFMQPSLPLTTLDRRDTTYAGPMELRTVRPIDLPNGERTARISYVEHVGDNRVLVHALLVEGDAQGQPQLYLSRQLGKAEEVIRGPYPAEPYVPLVPDTVATQNIVQQLQRGRIEVQPLPGEPAGEVLDIYDQAAFTRIQGLTPAEVRRLDFEFRDNGDFVWLTGSRVLQEGHWYLTEDRNFLLLTRGDRPFTEANIRPITAYTDEYIAFKLPVRVATQRNRVPGRFSFYETEVEVRFYVG